MYKKILYYFAYVGILGHILLAVIFFAKPVFFNKLIQFPITFYYNKVAKIELDEMSAVFSIPMEEQISLAFKPWKPFENLTIYKQKIAINGTFYPSLVLALSSLNAGDELQFYSGIYTTPFQINKSDVTIKGFGHVVFEKSAYKGKGFIVNRGNNLTIENIECRYVSVSDNNGACIRQEGKGLSLNHVYFHHSENGILETGKSESSIFIEDSRFELLGKGGRAHGIYLTKANLYITNSLFIASKDEGHAIKSRGKDTYISQSIITSMSSNDSRLIDISNGGKLTVEQSLLHQGFLSVNGQAIGVGLEGVKKRVNKIVLKDNIILLERFKHNILLAKDEKISEVKIVGNIIVGKTQRLNDSNIFFTHRKEAGFPEYPLFPDKICEFIKPCPLVDLH